MSIEQKHIFSCPNGTNAITLSEWVATLSPTDKAAYDIAAAKQEAIMDAEKASGNLISDTPGMQIWRDGPVINDPDWKAWFDRFLAESNITHIIE